MKVFILALFFYQFDNLIRLKISIRLRGMTMLLLAMWYGKIRVVVFSSMVFFHGKLVWNVE